MGNPQKDNFHKFILDIDKIATSDILDSTILINFLFPKGGGRWEKTFRIFFLIQHLLSKVSGTKPYDNLDNHHYIFIFVRIYTTN